MHVDTARRIDRLVGVPLSAVVSGLLRVYWSIKPVTPCPMHRILFIELSEMGTAILAEPAMRKIRRLTHAELFFVIFKRNADSLALTGTISHQNIFTIRDDTFLMLAWDTVRFVVWSRRNAIDTAVDLELFSRYTSLLTGLSGCFRRSGFYRFHNEGLYRGEMLTHRVAYNPHIHIAKNFIAQIDALLSADPQIPYSKTVIPDDELDLPVASPSAGAIEAMSRKIRTSVPGFEPSQQRLILINAGGSEFIPQRRWMPERFGDLIRRILTAHEDAFVLIVGSPIEVESASSVAANVGHPRCFAFAGRSTIPELPALYALASLMVTTDSGPGHFAPVCGLPTVVLFGPETPELYKPLGDAQVIHAGLACSPCVNAQNHRRTPCTDNICMQAISVDEVFTAVARILAR
jgi:ADP-heptose:LPS heptosyltransferase